MFKVRRFGCKVEGDKGLVRYTTQAEGDTGLADIQHNQREIKV